MGQPNRYISNQVIIYNETQIQTINAHMHYYSKRKSYAIRNACLNIVIDTTCPLYLPSVLALCTCYAFLRPDIKYTVTVCKLYYNYASIIVTCSGRPDLQSQV